LIELLVVLAIVGILAALLLPVLGRAKGHAQITQCLSNLHQIGQGMQMYLADNNSTFPPHANKPWGESGRVVYGLALGGQDPLPEHAVVAPATNRPLYSYIQQFGVFRCPADKGMEEPDAVEPGGGSGIWKPTKYETLGCSYCFNSASIGNSTRQAADGADEIGENLSRKKESWVPEHVRFILIYEPPATWWENYYHWHLARGQTTVTPDQITGDGQKFISPILFVDGHSASYDFTHALKDVPLYPMEPTKDWIWYKPKQAVQKEKEK
jgi:type II secretory pathway pseudopilin PulG